MFTVKACSFSLGILKPNYSIRRLCSTNRYNLTPERLERVESEFKEIVANDPLDSKMQISRFFHKILFKC